MEAYHGSWSPSQFYSGVVEGFDRFLFFVCMSSGLFYSLNWSSKSLEMEAKKQNKKIPHFLQTANRDDTFMS